MFKINSGLFDKLVFPEAFLFLNIYHVQGISIVYIPWEYKPSFTTLIEIEKKNHL